MTVADKRGERGRKSLKFADVLSGWSQRTIFSKLGNESYRR